ncbi:MAG: ribonuclease E inhibitor RraB [Fimbriimonadales bacterium]|nr:ribonuclease E inhibitor RraB [Fimbriimonadales bacterium]
MRADDWMALQCVLDAGVSPDAVCPFEHFLYFEDERLAGLAALALQEAGYQAEAAPALDGNWAVVVYAYHRPNASELERRIEFLEGVAEAFGGEYDGWGVPVKR